MTEQTLTGGNMDPVVRVGDTVRRVVGPWTDAVHTLLRRLADAGIDGVPRVQGFDERGREVLSFVNGSVLADAAPSVLWSSETLVDAARLLRRIHDASEPLASADLHWRTPAHPPLEVVCHNDFAPYNLIEADGLIESGGRLVGAIDFDTASPGSRLWDLAYLAYRIVPYAEDAAGFDPDVFGSREARLGQLIAAYGAESTPDEVRAMAANRLDDLAAFTDVRASETGRADFVEHAAMYRRDAARLRG